MEPTASALAIACALLCVVLSILTWHKRRRRLYEQASKFEGPPCLPVIGNALLFTGGNEAILKSVAELTKSYPSPYRVWLGHRLLLFVSDPEQIKAILTSPKTVEKSYLYDFYTPLVGMGLVTAPASTWRVHRRQIQPSFNSKIIDGFLDVFAAHSQILANKWEENSDGPEFEVFNLVAQTTMNMLFETVLGLKSGAESNSAVDYIDTVHKLGETVTARMFRPWLHPDFIFNRTNRGKYQQRALKMVHDFADNIIAMKKSELKRRSQPETAIVEDDECKRTPQREVFLDFLLKLSHEGDEWSDEELRDELTTMIVAGYDSTALTNSHVLLMLASHPEIQDEVYQELYEIYGDADVDERPVVHEDLRRMKCLERVIKETMRLFPLLPLIGRQVTGDLEIGEHTLPEGSVASIAVVDVHRSEKYWPDPLKFDPDRFLPEKVARRDPYTYLAFSGGPRNCIGIRYALTAMKTLHATILRRYVLKKDNIIPVKDIRIRIETALKTVEPVTLRIEKRTRN